MRGDSLFEDNRSDFHNNFFNLNKIIPYVNALKLVLSSVSNLGKHKAISSLTTLEKPWTKYQDQVISSLQLPLSLKRIEWNPFLFILFSFDRIYSLNKKLSDKDCPILNICGDDHSSMAKDNISGRFGVDETSWSISTNPWPTSIVRIKWPVWSKILRGLARITGWTSYSERL